MTRLTPLDADSRVIDLTPEAALEAAASSGNSRRICKFLLIEYRNVVQLVFGDVASYRYHANLLQQFCRQRGIGTFWTHQPDLLEPVDIDLTVLGGGILELNRNEGTAVFSGASKAYGAYPRRQLESIVAVGTVFAGMKIRTDL